jgi:pseudouridine-5'-phosphate glycosidase
VPNEFEISAVDLERTLDEALNEAELRKVGGRELTPFLLSRMSQISAGATLKANIALLENNARVAAQIAQAAID